MSKNENDVNNQSNSDTENNNDRRQFVKTVVTGASAITFAKLIPDASAQIAGSIPAITSLILEELPLGVELVYGPGDKIINVPSAANYMRIDAHGAGGGGSSIIGMGNGADGGSGGHVGLNYELEAINQLILSPGEGGSGAELSETASGGNNSGGDGGTAAESTLGASGGGGGGYSSVHIVGTESIPLISAAGGGGAGGRSSTGLGGSGGRGLPSTDVSRHGNDGTSTPASMQVIGEGANFHVGGAGAPGNAEFAKAGNNSIGFNGGKGGNHTSGSNLLPVPGGAGGGGGGGFLSSEPGGGGGGGAGAGIDEETSNGGGGGGGAGGANFLNDNNFDLPGEGNYYDESVTNTFTEDTQGGEGGVFESTTAGGDGGDGIITITFYESDPSV